MMGDWNDGAKEIDAKTEIKKWLVLTIRATAIFGKSDG